MDNLGKYLFYAGLLVAVAGAFMSGIAWIPLVLVFLGGGVGLLKWSQGKTGDHGFILAGLALAASYAAMTIIPVVGGYLTGFMSGLWTMVGTALLLHAFKMLLDWGQS
jgi:hypothetical protein